MSELYNIFPVKEVSGNPATFEDGADGIPVESFSVIADPMPDLTGLNAYRTGKNLCKIGVINGRVSNGITYTENADGSVHAKGTATAESFSAGGPSTETKDTRCFYALPAGTYTISNIGALRLYCGFRNADNTANLLDGIYLASGSAYTFTATDSVIVYVRISVTNGGTVDDDACAMVTAGSTAATIYEPWNFQSFPLDSSQIDMATLLGANNIWSDAGPVTLQYHSDAGINPKAIEGLVVDGVNLQDDAWFLKWRRLSAPAPKTDYVSVFGKDGDVDLTENETDGQVFYENRSLALDMKYIGEDWETAYSDLLNLIHGKRCFVQFSNDPYWYWSGRIIASEFDHKSRSLAMSGIMFPYKLSVAKIIKTASVDGAIEGTAETVTLPGSRMRVSPLVTVTTESESDSVTLKWGNSTKALSAGTYYVRGLKVGADDVTIKVWGTGTVNFEYRKGML